MGQERLGLPGKKSREEGWAGGAEGAAGADGGVAEPAAGCWASLGEGHHMKERQASKRMLGKRWVQSTG